MIDEGAKQQEKNLFVCSLEMCEFSVCLLVLMAFYLDKETGVLYCEGFLVDGSKCIAFQ